MFFAGSNVYGGLTEVKGGVLVVQNPQALGGATAGTTVDAGASLELQSDLALEPVTLNGGGGTLSSCGPTVSTAQSLAAPRSSPSAGRH